MGACTVFSLPEFGSRSVPQPCLPLIQDPVVLPGPFCGTSHEKEVEAFHSKPLRLELAMKRPSQGEKKTKKVQKVKKLADHDLPCSPRAVMLPTGKTALCDGIKQRMRRCKGKQVQEVLWKMTYRSPKGVLTYNLRDLRYDLRAGYLKVKTKLSSAPKASRKSVMISTGKQAKCPGVNDRMRLERALG